MHAHAHEGGRGEELEMRPPLPFACSVHARTLLIIKLAEERIGVCHAGL